MLRLAAAAAAGMTLASCASAPSPAGGAGAGLALCSARVTNAPAVGAGGRVRDFTTHLSVRGVAVARTPVSGCLSSGFGPRRGGAGSTHKGIDIFTREPRPVFAAADGRVIEAGRQNGFGRIVIIRHRNDVTTWYAHLSSLAPGIREGARVRAGEVIARTGRTGNATAIHLHYEIRAGGRALNPLQ